MSYPPSVYVLVPNTNRAKAWLKERCPDATQFGKGIVIEHRYVDDIMFGIEVDGLSDEFSLQS